MIKFDHQTQFVTITCLNWKPFLKNDYHKQIIVEALQRRIAKDEISIYCYVIMPNHMHFLWQLHDGIIREDFQRDFLKFTARSILAFMKMNDDELHQDTIVQTSDRKHQVWERNALRIDIYSEKVFQQKMTYIHKNPFAKRWKLARFPEDYKYSSARYYQQGIDTCGIVTDYRG